MDERPPPLIRVEFDSPLGLLWTYENDMKAIKRGETFTLKLDNCELGRDEQGQFIKIRVRKKS